MPLVIIRELTFGFHGLPLLDSVSCHIDAGQRIGLLGRNGAGKTTLMRLISGSLEPDSGEVTIESGKRVALLRQDVPQEIVENVLQTGSDLEQIGEILSNHFARFNDPNNPLPLASVRIDRAAR